MSYLWENYSVTNHYELAVKDFSPYLEIFNCINGRAKVNILYRFGALYNDVSEVILDKKGNADKEVSNILFHMLANIDFYAGITQKDVILMKIEKELREGRYGVRRDVFEHLIFEHKYALLSYMYMRKENDRNCLFFDYLADVFGAVLMYSEFEDTYIVQISCSRDTGFGRNNSYSAEELYEMAKQILCDFWLDVEVYWQVPIGICGAEMEIENVQII